MTGAEHFAKAEDLLVSADVAIGQYEERGWEAKRDIADNLTAQAQVHATLALAAATALGSRERDGEQDPDGMDPVDRREWEHVASAGLAEPDPEPEEYDPGPEVDDEGEMSEYRYMTTPEEPW